MGKKVPFVDLPTQFSKLEAELLPVIKDVIFKRADFVMRGDLREFEESAAAFVGTKYAVGLNSGTDAIRLSILAAGIGSGDEIITVGHTFAATVAAIVHCGATPVLVDVGDDYNMDMNGVEKAVTPKTKAVIPVHLNGRLCNMEKLLQIAKKHNLIIIEDAAQALGATFDGKKAGNFGLAGCFSLYPMKTLGGIGDGGLVTTNNEEFAKTVRRLGDHGHNRPGRDILFFGYNSRMDNVNAAVLNVKLRHLSEWIERRREVAEMYRKRLSHFPSVKLPHFSDPRYFDAYQNYVIRAENRDELASHLGNEGIETLISWPQPLHFNKSLNLKRFHLPKTEELCKEVISLPMNTELNNDQVGLVIKCVSEFLSRLPVH